MPLHVWSNKKSVDDEEFLYWKNGSSEGIVSQTNFHQKKLISLKYLTVSLPVWDSMKPIMQFSFKFKWENLCRWDLLILIHLFGWYILVTLMLLLQLIMTSHTYRWLIHLHSTQGMKWLQVIEWSSLSEYFNSFFVFWRPSNYSLLYHISQNIWTINTWL